MTVKKRIQTIRIIEKMKQDEKFSKKLGLKDVSIYKRRMRDG